MKKIILVLVVCFISIIFFSFAYMQSSSPETDIVGIWIHENETDNKWEFTNDGFCYWYNEDGIKEETFTYSISYLSTQCDFQVQSNSLTNPNQFYYLQLVDNDNEKLCYDINVDNLTLSMSFMGTSGFEVFNKE